MHSGYIRPAVDKCKKARSLAVSQIFPDPQANQRLPMYQIRRILQLRQQGYSKRAIAATLALARSTVDQYLATIESHFDSLEQALSWQDDQLHRLFAQPLVPKADRVGDLYERFTGFDTLLSKPGVTRFQLWSLYKQDNPEGLQYTAAADRAVLSAL